MSLLMKCNENRNKSRDGVINICFCCFSLFPLVSVLLLVFIHFFNTHKKYKQHSRRVRWTFRNFMSSSFQR